MRLRAVLVLLVIMIALTMIFFAYRHRHPPDHLEVDPHARKEIEKAKRR